MDKLDRTKIEFYLGASATILSVVLPMNWWVRCFFVLCVAGIIVDLACRSPITIQWTLWRKIALSAFGVAILVGISWKPIKDDYIGIELPDVTLRFAYQAAPALILSNNSGVTAQQIKWTVLLWNLDLPRAYSNNPHLSDAHEPLPIPVGIFDFIKPHSDGGAQNLFNSPLVSPFVKPGNRLFGSASVVCRNCIRGHTYFVYIVFGQSGWFWELLSEKSGNVLYPAHLTIKEVQSFFDEVSKRVPNSEKIAIGYLEFNQHDPIAVPKMSRFSQKRHILGASFVERVDNVALEDRPETFDCLSVDRADDVLSFGVVNHSLIASQHEVGNLEPVAERLVSVLRIRIRTFVQSAWEH